MEGTITRQLRRDDNEIVYSISSNADSDNEYAVEFMRGDERGHTVYGYATREGLYEFGQMLVRQFAPVNGNELLTTQQIIGKEVLISALLEDNRFNQAVTGAVRNEVSKRFQVAADAASE